MNGPVILAVNHPNSFLDGIILTVLFNKDVYSLTRGDAFRNKRAAAILRWLHLLPVYRYSEGAENLNHNYTTFRECHKALAQNNIVLIFSEGGCKNEWHLRPLRKGTARLALGTWEKNIDAKVIPVGLNYNPFRSFGKNVHINFGVSLDKEIISNEPTEGKKLLAFNEQLRAQLQQLVYEIDEKDRKKMRSLLYVPLSTFKKIALAFPALLGWIVHAPIYYPAKISTNIFFNNEHYDGVMVALLYLAYPLYVFAAAFVVAYYFGLAAAILVFVLLPFTAWAAVQLKTQM